MSRLCNCLTDWNAVGGDSLLRVTSALLLGTSRTFHVQQYYFREYQAGDRDDREGFKDSDAHIQLSRWPRAKKPPIFRPTAFRSRN